MIEGNFAEWVSLELQKKSVVYLKPYIIAKV